MCHQRELACGGTGESYPGPNLETPQGVGLFFTLINFHFKFWNVTQTHKAPIQEQMQLFQGNLFVAGELWLML